MYLDNQYILHQWPRLVYLLINFDWYSLNSIHQPEQCSSKFCIWLSLPSASLLNIGLISATGTPTGAEVSTQEVSNDLASLRYRLSN